MSKKWRCIIKIDGKSAEDLFAAGPIDIKDFFLPEKLGVNPEDVESVRFQEDVDANTVLDAFEGKVSISVHKDNFTRGDKNEADD